MIPRAAPQRKEFPSLVIRHEIRLDDVRAVVLRFLMLSGRSISVPEHIPFGYVSIEHPKSSFGDTITCLHANCLSPRYTQNDTRKKQKEVYSFVSFPFNGASVHVPTKKNL